MLIRSMILTMVLGCLTLGCVNEDASAPSDEDSAGTTIEYSKKSYSCSQDELLAVAQCIGITGNTVYVVNIKNVHLSNTQLVGLQNVLSNVVSVGDIDIDASHLKIAALNYLINNLHLNVINNDVGVCLLTGVCLV